MTQLSKSQPGWVASIHFPIDRSRYRKQTGIS